ncbi:small multi-drug export protein [Candidatus Gracilibacteria bacterium]|jgi:uncharacterized membrane protein|nr:small multi-drug export protein [Candidatus Gracilibacteria bacterium]
MLHPSLIPPEIIVFFTAMTPFADIKLSIPLGMKLGLTGFSSAMFSIAGTLTMGAIILALLGPISRFGMKHSEFLNKYFTKLFEKTRSDHSEKVAKYGSIFLPIFVALPLPGSGVTGGAILAFIFGIEYFKSLALIFIGTAIPAIVITFGAKFIFMLIHWLS